QGQPPVVGKVGQERGGARVEFPPRLAAGEAAVVGPPWAWRLRESPERLVDGQVRRLAVVELPQPCVRHGFQSERGGEVPGRFPGPEQVAREEPDGSLSQFVLEPLGEQPRLAVPTFCYGRVGPASGEALHVVFGFGVADEDDGT